MFDVNIYLPLFIAGGSPDTIRHYTTEINNFNNWCFSRNIKPEDITELDARQYINFLQGKNYAAASIKIKLAALKNYYNIAIKLGIVNFNPFKDIITKKPTYDDTNFEYLSTGELAEICAKLQEPDLTSRRNLAIILLMAVEGLRTVEVHRMNDADINFKRSTIFIHGKGHDDFIYPCADTMKTLRAYLEQRDAATVIADDDGTPTFISFSGKYFGQRLSRNGLRSIVNQILQDADIKTVGNSCHMLRHSCGTNLYAETKDLRLVQETLRQRSPEMAARYAHVNMRIADRATSRISPIQKKIANPQID